MIDERLLKPWNATEQEQTLYDAWEKSGLFSPDGCIKAGITTPDAPYFSIVLPPPNVTGTLHMGHAAMLAIEDILVRYHRMKGERTVWIPGTDHAAIATQSKVEKILDKTEGKRRHDLGREEFLKRVETFAEESRETIVNQIRRMGSSIDWSRQAYTLDEQRTSAVRTAFKRMFDDGLIYRDYRIVNWDPKGQTTISDDEVVYETAKTKLYTFKYSADFPISISTTRPETKIGDTGVAVHPDDKRYKKYIGKTFDIDFCGVPLHIKVVGDDAVDPAFGTGAVGVTPAHSAIDWEIAQRHKLSVIPVIDERARITVAHETLTGKKVTEARTHIVELLEKQGLIEKREDIEHNIAKAERTGGVIEPLPKLQWFIAVNKKFTVRHSAIPGIKSGASITLKEMMRAAVANKGIRIIPDRFEKVYYHWIDNLRDWCISRQIWFGHRIPVWYKGEEIHVGEPPKGLGWEQDSDTLDTWFSSGLWTFSTLGWPDENAPDLRAYHPTSLMETGYDILFFWVARMILMSGYFLGDIPFRDVYLHGLVRDAKGRKMSKSLDNNIDPLEMIAKYGADATRLSLIIGTGPGNDLKLSEDKVRGYKNFANKLWNIARFVLSNTEGVTPDRKRITEDADKKILAEFDAITKDVTSDIDAYRLYLAAEKLYHYVWHTFADIIIERSKPIISSGDDASKRSTQTLLRCIFSDCLTLLHPFIPFVTEGIHAASGEQGFLMTKRWPS